MERFAQEEIVELAHMIFGEHPRSLLASGAESDYTPP